MLKEQTTTDTIKSRVHFVTKALEKSREKNERF